MIIRDFPKFIPHPTGMPAIGFTNLCFARTQKVLDTGDMVNLSMKIGVAGMMAAQAQVNIRAQNIVNVNTRGYQPVIPEQVSNSNSGPRVNAQIKPQSQMPPPALMAAGTPQMFLQLSQVDLGSEVVQMKMAELAYKASASVIAVAIEQDKAMLEAFGAGKSDSKKEDKA
jgi:flagellar basal body rod protein FlgG